MDREKLIKADIGYDEGVHHFGGKAELYEKYLIKFFDGNDIAVLRRALEGEDYEAAFRAAHNMKGGAGNLSITALFNKVCELVDALRAGKRDSSLLIMCTEAERLYKEARKAVKGE